MSPYVNTQYTVTVQISTFFDGRTKGLTDMVKYKDSRYILIRRKRRRTSNKRRQLQN